jgi:hypothetical protein
VLTAVWRNDAVLGGLSECSRRSPLDRRPQLSLARPSASRQPPYHPAQLLLSTQMRARPQFQPPPPTTPTNRETNRASAQHSTRGDGRGAKEGDDGLRQGRLSTPSPPLSWSVHRPPWPKPSIIRRLPPLALLPSPLALSSRALESALPTARATQQCSQQRVSSRCPWYHRQCHPSSTNATVASHFRYSFPPSSLAWCMPRHHRGDVRPSASVSAPRLCPTRFLSTSFLLLPRCCPSSVSLSSASVVCWEGSCSLCCSSVC